VKEMGLLKSNQEIWKRELSLATHRDVWKLFAIETKCCLEFLLEKYETAMNGDDVFISPFFGYKYVRMLMGYSLENLIKGLLLSGKNKGKYFKRGGISFQKRGHDLVWLLQELEVQIDVNESFYINAWSISAEWFGKYPFPLEMNKVLPEYMSLPTSEALSRRMARGNRDITHNDLLHSSIGVSERELFANIFAMLLSMYDRERKP
jgi:hypothetical protein